MTRDGRRKIRTGNERTGDHPALGKTRIQRSTWECKTCSYAPIARTTHHCPNCGRDKYGLPGPIPDNDDKPARAQVREGITEYP